MTTGERIRYCRYRVLLTQAELAEKTGIHPVSIRKYETNKMIPQPEQIRRIANVLCVSYTAISGLDCANLDIESDGDFVGFIMQLQKKGLISFTGTRDPENHNLYKTDTFRIKINHKIAQYFTLFVNDYSKSIEVSGDQLFIQLPEDMAYKLICWDGAVNAYNDSKKMYKEPYPADVEEGLKILADNVDKIEIEAQANPTFVVFSSDSPIMRKIQADEERAAMAKTIEDKLGNNPIAQLIKSIFSPNQ